MSRGSVLVVGGGIGGLSAAIALRQADYAVTVVEKQADLHSSVYGVGIIQPANALRALDSIGCADACMEEGFAAPAWGAMYDTQGNFVRDIAAARIEDYPPMNGITRPKLHEILTSRALEVGVELCYSTTFTALRPMADHVEADLDDGRSARYDLVVGADGVRSKVRPFVLHADLVPHYIGQSAYRVNIPREPEMDRILLQFSRAGMAGVVPIGRDLAYLFFNAEMEREARPQDDLLADVLRQHLAPFGGLVGRIRDQYINDSDEVVLRPEEALIAPAPWHAGRIVLVGDAVHSVTPHLGQGAAQAIEDGVVLADCLASHAPDDVENAFTEYSARRFERCKLVVEVCQAIGEYETGDLPDFDIVSATNHVLEVMAQPI